MDDIQSGRAALTGLLPVAKGCDWSAMLTVSREHCGLGIMLLRCERVASRAGRPLGHVLGQRIDGSR
jgi:hypothetical protein